MIYHYALVEQAIDMILSRIASRMINFGAFYQLFGRTIGLASSTFMRSGGRLPCLRNCQKLPVSLIHFSSALQKVKAKKGKKMEVFIDPRDANEYIDLSRVMEDMTNAVEKLKKDYVHNFRVGVNTKLLDNIDINLEGMKLQLNEVAKIRKKSERIIEMDFVSFPEAIKPAMVAIQSSSLNLNPSIEGTKLEVPIPPVTAEHRKGLAKNAKQRLNELKEEIKRIRNIHEKKLKSVENLPKDTDTAIRKQIGAYLEIKQTEAENIFKMKEKDLLLK